MRPDNITLFKEYKFNPTTANRDRIFKANLPLAWEMARIYKAKCPSQSLEDLLQVASIGMIAAIASFNPERGKFNSYASLCMHHELCRYLHNDSPVKISRKLSDLYQRGKKLTGADQEIADKLGVPVDEWREAVGAYAARTATSLEIFFPVTNIFHDEWSKDLNPLPLRDTIASDEFTPYDSPDTPRGKIPDEYKDILLGLFMEWEAIAKVKAKARSQMGITKTQFGKLVRTACLSASA